LICALISGAAATGPQLRAAEETRKPAVALKLSQSVRRAAMIEAMGLKLREAGVKPLPGEQKYSLPINASNAEPGWQPGGEGAVNALVVGYLPVAEESDGPDRPYIGLGTRFDVPGCEDSTAMPKLGEQEEESQDGVDPCIAGLEALASAAERLAEKGLEQPVLLAAWRGEVDLERWLPVDRLKAFVSLDQVGRLHEDRLFVRGAKSSSAWPKLIEQSNVVVGFDVETEKYAATDAAVLYEARVPTLELSGGQEGPMTSISTEDVERVAQLAYLLVHKLAHGSTQPELSSEAADGAGREPHQIYTGTVPDYTAKAEGLRLSGVVEGGPADRAGLREGDVIIRFGEHDIGNVYDYSDALAETEPNVAINVVVLRDGAELIVTLTPSTRE
jgi:hypothetical protein